MYRLFFQHDRPAAKQSTERFKSGCVQSGRGTSFRAVNRPGSTRTSDKNTRSGQRVKKKHPNAIPYPRLARCRTGGLLPAQKNINKISKYVRIKRKFVGAQQIEPGYSPDLSGPDAASLGSRRSSRV